MPLWLRTHFPTGMLNPKALHLRGNAGAGKRWTIPAHDFVLVEVETTAA